MTSVPSSGADPEFRHLEATLYWELRRWLFNLALLPAAFLGYLRSFPVLGIGNLPPQPGLVETLLGIAGWVAGANLVYSVVYPLERFVGTRLNPGWRAFGAGIRLLSPHHDGRRPHHPGNPQTLWLGRLSAAFEPALADRNRSESAASSPWSTR